MNNFEEKVYKLISREIEVSNFEKWVYSEKELEKILTNDDYLELVSLNYTTPSSLYEAEKILKKHIEIEKYHEWYLRNILQKIIERPDNVYKYIVETYDLYCNGYNFLDNLGIGYGLGIEVPHSSYSAQSWGNLESIEQKELIDNYYPNIKKEAEKVIDWLDSKKIILTGYSGDFQGIEYKDNRNQEEKETANYGITTPKKNTENTSPLFVRILRKVLKIKD